MSTAFIQKKPQAKLETREFRGEHLPLAVKRNQQIFFPSQRNHTSSAKAYAPDPRQGGKGRNIEIGISSSKNGVTILGIL